MVETAVAPSSNAGSVLSAGRKKWSSAFRSNVFTRFRAPAPPPTKTAASSAQPDAPPPRPRFEARQHSTHVMHFSDEPWDKSVTPADWSVFRDAGKGMVDYVTDYFSRVDSLPVQSQVAPGSITRALNFNVGDAPSSMRDIMHDVDTTIMEGMTHWQHPRFYGYFTTATYPPSVLADMISNMFSSGGFNWESGPAIAEMDKMCMEALGDLLGIPDKLRKGPRAAAVIQSMASESSLTTVLAARDRAVYTMLNRMSNDESEDEEDDGGMAASLKMHALYAKMTLYVSDQTHCCIQKGARIAGIEPNLRVIRTRVDNNMAMDPKDLAAAMERDVAAGFTPIYVAASVGTTGTCAIDDLNAIADVTDKYSLCWLHVDGAWAGVAAICPEHRHILNGLDRVDSFCTNPHKWLLTGLYVSAVWFKDATWVLSVLSITPAFLRQPSVLHTAASSAIGRAPGPPDYKDLQVFLGHRFESLKIYFMLRCYGADKLREHIRTHCRLAQQFAELVRQDPNWEIVTPPVLAIVCFRCKSSNAANGFIRKKMSIGGVAMLTHATVEGRYILRLAVGAPLTTESDIVRTWRELQRLRLEAMGEDFNGLQ